jgi:hypothetical protein
MDRLEDKVQQEHKGVQDTKDLKVGMVIRVAKEIRAIRALKAGRVIKEMLESKETKEIRETKDQRGPLDLPVQLVQFRDQLVLKVLQEGLDPLVRQAQLLGLREHRVNLGLRGQLGLLEPPVLFQSVTS